jgi:tetraprenyl-beta-curcumene synthase
VVRVVGNRLGLAAVFAGAARRYWLSVFPQVCRERRALQARAAQIPDAALRDMAFEAQGKWSNIEGATAFAAFAPRTHRAAAVRGAAGFQCAYNYLDRLGERPIDDPTLNGRQLHQALLVAVDPDAPHIDYYEHYPLGDDNGYLAEMIDSCREAVRSLPSYRVVAPSTRKAAERIVAFQSFNTGEHQGDHDSLEAWAQRVKSPDEDLLWWEAAASAGSSLGVHSLIAAAARPGLAREEVLEFDRAYFPWIGALHSMLDNVIDADEDHQTAQRSLISYYASAQEACTRMRTLTRRSIDAAAALPDPLEHELLFAAMACSYLSAPEAAGPQAKPIMQAVLDELGELAGPPMLVFRARAWLQTHVAGR